ncbi:MAG: two-component sensor histidine kinase [Alicyclobacillaceae bacterium]|nr:two-component sensor histidine kinase [Alicyclobacillaceae bacterium]
MIPDWMNLGVLFVGDDLYVTLCNGPARRFVYSWPEGVDRVRLDDCFPVRSEEYRLLTQIVRGRRDLCGWLGPWETGGQLRHVVLDAKRVDRPGRTGIHVVFRDLGDIVALEHELLRSDKLATAAKMAAGIAHEIRNPLTTVKGFLQLFEQQFAQLEMGAELEYTRLMLTEVERVNALVEELLVLAKPDTSVKSLCRVDEMLAAISPVVEAEANARGVDYTWDAAELLEVVGDAELMKQVFLNLARNALEAMEDGGRLKISAYRSGRWVCVDVSDTGPGIPFYQFDKIFDTFYTTKQSGTGLGLAICQKIVTEHGGEIRVSSKGYGSTFSVLLPARQEC